MKRDKTKAISIIIPVLNEAEYINVLLSHLKKSRPHYCAEIIVIDGGSTDNTVGLAKSHGVKVLSSEKGRARQMNLGARHARGTILYFLHVDTLPPKTFDETILHAVTNESQAGCFQMRFDSDSLLLRFFAWFTRINHRICRGGDQSLFITKELFLRSGGFNEDYRVYEDNEFVGRLYRETNFKVLPQKVRTSARKYEKMGPLRLQFYFGIIHIMNYLGAGPEQLYQYYNRKISI
ncbi:MAG: TIGR04283 family arsenosugar biosynthesis glycosyltransferase [Bacteroidota bacterium]